MILKVNSFVDNFKTGLKSNKKLILNATSSALNLLINLLFIRLYIQKQGIESYSVFIVNIAYLNFISLITTLPTSSLQRHLLRRRNFIERHFGDLILFGIISLFLCLIFQSLNKTDFIICLIPISLSFINFITTILDFYNEQLLKFKSIILSSIIFTSLYFLKIGIVNSYVSCLIFRSVFVILNLHVKPIFLIKAKILKSYLSVVAFSFSQLMYDSFLKIILAGIVSPISISFYDISYKIFFGLRSFVGSITSPLIFKFYKNRLLYPFKDFYILILLTLPLYLVLPGLLSLFYFNRFDSVFIFYSYSIGLAFWVNSFFALNYAWLNKKFGMYSLSIVTLLIVIITFFLVKIDFQLSLAFSVALLIHSVTPYIIQSFYYKSIKLDYTKFQ